MTKEELLKLVRKIEIQTKGLSNQVFTGNYHAAFKGRGMSFSEVRSYLYGDDVRSIDWNVTARYGDPHIKVYEEERELTVVMLVDTSHSTHFGTQSEFKNISLAKMAALLSFSAMQNNDKVGVLFFGNKLEKYLPPKKGKGHFLRIIREVIETETTESGTDLNHALEQLNNLMKRRCIVFVMSDFYTKDYEKALKIVSRKHDVIGVHIYDEMEKQLPDLGLLKTKDLETGKEIWVNTNSESTKGKQANSFEAHVKKHESIFRKNKSDFISLSTQDNFTTAFMNLFKTRGKRR